MNIALNNLTNPFKLLLIPIDAVLLKMRLN
jgi:hypothetical protein